MIDADYLKTWFGEKDLYTYDYIIGTIDDAPTIEPETKFLAEVKLSKEELQELVDKAAEKIRKEMELPEQHWVPCSERLPELDDEVLVTDDRGELRHCIFCTWGETWCGFTTYEEGMRIKAAAWMPLPEPWEGEQE